MKKTTMIIPTQKCSFCDKKTFEHQIIKESRNFYVIHARRPLSRGHCLIIPIIHASTGLGIDKNASDEFIVLVNEMMQALSKSFNSSGMNFFANYGASAGQEISHAHFHLVPRFESDTQSPFDKLKDSFFLNRSAISPEELNSEISLIKRELD